MTPGQTACGIRAHSDIEEHKERVTRKIAPKTKEAKKWKEKQHAKRRENDSYDSAWLTNNTTRAGNEATGCWRMKRESQQVLKHHTVMGLCYRCVWTIVRSVAVSSPSQTCGRKASSSERASTTPTASTEATTRETALSTRLAISRLLHLWYDVLQFLPKSISKNVEII